MTDFNTQGDRTPSALYALADLRIPQSELMFASNFEDIDVFRPISLVTAQMDNSDPTEVIPDGEVFVVRQVDEDGNTHMIVLTEKMAIELTGLMNAWISLG